ncbi:ANM_HP_G0056490.mRNA.1.CDS.1 [Saccharomyces cerevisiae]|nr:ANM_HP_G0056490.mRNA.1.CDS.1 [Saccharomyces cerevisiae]CAI7028436.1 ANM_HP_G0056490.mRNA.1.CDS.1 [Saccharomyces cerevisiae]
MVFENAESYVLHTTEILTCNWKLLSELIVVMTPLIEISFEQFKKLHNDANVEVDAWWKKRRKC